MQTFEDVKKTNIIVYNILRRGGSLEDCIVALDAHSSALFKRILDLMSIAPMKVRIRDRVFVYHCPDELIPERRLVGDDHNP